MHKIISTLLIFFLLATKAIAQRPQEILLDDDPFDFSDPVQLVLVVVIPLILLIFGVFYFKRKRK